MQVEEIQRAVIDDAAGIASFHTALTEYAAAYHETYVASSGTGLQPQRLQQSAERVKTTLPDGRRSWEHAADKLRSQGLWTDELDRLIGRQLVRRIDESDLTGREKAAVKKLLRESGGARANIEKAVGMLQQLPTLMDRDEESARSRAAGQSESDVEVLRTSQDACAYWWLVFWMCWMAAIWITTGTGGTAWPVFGVCAIPALIALYWCTR